MHLTNPKAIFVWLSIVSLALPVGAQTIDALKVVLGCSALGLLVFGGYAIFFSTPAARCVYASLRRWFEGALAMLFGYAGLRMLMSVR
jgi:threonine efflux protein